MPEKKAEHNSAMSAMMRGVEILGSKLSNYGSHNFYCIVAGARFPLPGCGMRLSSIGKMASTCRNW